MLEHIVQITEAIQAQIIQYQIFIDQIRMMASFSLLTVSNPNDYTDDIKQLNISQVINKKTHLATTGAVKKVKEHTKGFKKDSATH